MNMEQTQALLDAIKRARKVFNLDDDKSEKEDLNFLLSVFIYKFGEDGKFMLNNSQLETIFQAIKKKYGEFPRLHIERQDDWVSLQLVGNKKPTCEHCNH